MEKWQPTLSILQTILLFGAFLGALYFGFKQQEINDKLAKIEEYNYEQTLLNEEVKILIDKKELRNITTDIISDFGWRNQQERELINNRSRKERLRLITKINNLLYEGLDNKLLVKDKKALSKWLKAINYLEMYKEFSHNDIISGTIVDETGERDDPTANDTFDKGMRDSMGRAFSMVLEVHSSLGLSLSKISMELSKELSKNKQQKK